MKTNWIISQIGARQHYGVPRGFHRLGELRLLYTEAWCRSAHRLLSRGPRQLRAFAARYHADIPSNLVVSFNGRVFAEIIANLPRSFTTMEQSYLEYLRVGRWFASAVAQDLKSRRLDPREDVFFGFNTACLETLELMRRRRIPTICDQIDPARVEADIVREECRKWPGWQKSSGQIPDSYWNHMRQEWDTADLVLVNSKWSMNALIQQGVPAEKMVIVPVAHEAAHRPSVPPTHRSAIFSVLWLGTVNLRKGIQYLIQAARELIDHREIQFIVAGPVDISDDALATAPGNMKFLGRVTRDQTDSIYLTADVFVLPTLSDGFAITQVEAMSQGLPVITTPNCGDVVTHGTDGLIVPPFDGHALAEAISTLASDREMVQQMSHRALQRSKDFSLDHQSMLIGDAVKHFRDRQP
jgi:glycosyltransferase involved in cell wall biosynthesis